MYVILKGRIILKKEKLKRIAKRITAFAAAAAMAATFTFPTEIGEVFFDGFGIAIVASAETGNFTVIGGTEGTDYSYSENVLTILKETPLTISGTTTTDRIEVAYGVSANITFDGVDIDVSGTENACAFKIADYSTGEVTITLAYGTTNVLKSGEYCAGLQKNGTSGKLTIEGTGTLEATGGNIGAGIGGGEEGTGSGITISGGTVTATGGDEGAGIGGGWSGTGSGITISGGTVTATGGINGAGIGGGFNRAGSGITISGGTVTATGGDESAGIGGGWSGTGSGITISGGTVTATGGSSGAGIGGGLGGTGSDITISGGSVKAVAGSSANAIGGGENQSAVTPTNGSKNVYLLEIDNPSGAAIYIDGKEVTPVKHNDETKVYVYLTGENHTVKLGENEAVTYNFIESTGSFGKADNSDAMDFKVTGGEYGVDYNYSEDDTTLYILTETAVTIRNKDDVSETTDKIAVGDGINANITLAGVNIDVSETDFACAFRIADNSTGEVTITIADGTTNVLKSGNYCAGLQKNGTSGKLTINGTGTLEATGGTNGAGIGGGKQGTGSGITISGGTVTATGGSRGAGIGGGYGGAGSGITISGGSVKAVAGSSANAIGGGEYADAVTPTNGTGNVYLLTIENPDGKDVFIDGSTTPYKPSNHSAADTGDTNLYAYLTGETHKVKIGDEETEYKFDTNKFLPVPKAIYFTFTAPTDLVYDGNAKTATVEAKNGITGIGTITVKYYDADGNKLDSAPVVPGTYTVKIDVTAGTNYAAVTDLTADSWKFSIDKATPNVTAPTATAITYGQALSASKLSDAKWSWVDGNTIPTVKNSGYDAKMTVDDSNYDYTDVEGYDSTNHTVTRTIAVTVNPAPAKVLTAPSAIKNLVFDGNSKELVTAGTASGGTMVYSLDGVSFSETIPTATEAGTYTVHYKVSGDENHSDSAVGQVSVTIDSAAEIITGITVSKTAVVVTYGYEGTTVTARTENVAFADVTVEMVEWMKNSKIQLIIDFVNAFTAADTDCILTDAQLRAIEYVLEHDLGIAA